jgi:hypothetical protein
MKRKTIDFLINKKIKNYQQEFNPHFTHVFRKSTYLFPKTPLVVFNITTQINKKLTPLSFP